MVVHTGRGRACWRRWEAGGSRVQNHPGLLILTLFMYGYRCILGRLLSSRFPCDFLEKSWMTTGQYVNEDRYKDSQYDACKTNSRTHQIYPSLSSQRHPRTQRWFTLCKQMCWAKEGELSQDWFISAPPPAHGYQLEGEINKAFSLIPTPLYPLKGAASIIKKARTENSCWYCRAAMRKL